jgi:hypothetical protein
MTPKPDIKPWHICAPPQSRSFVEPGSLWRRVILWLRGYRPHPYGTKWWSKAYHYE